MQGAGGALVQEVVVNLVYVGFTEVVPTVGRERELISNRYTVTT